MELGNYRMGLETVGWDKGAALWNLRCAWSYGMCLVVVLVSYEMLKWDPVSLELWMVLEKKHMGTVKWDNSSLEAELWAAAGSCEMHL